MLELFKSLNKRAFISSLIVSVLLVLLIFIGSRDLQNFDAALIGYLFGTVFAAFGITYRCSIWLQRPPTKMYWKRTWSFLFSLDFFPYALKSTELFIQNIIGQKFIYPRGKKRWLGHFLMATGCMAAFAITVPLTFGWIHFALQTNSYSVYEVHIFGFNIMNFKLGSPMAFIIFHALVWCSVLVILGTVIMMRKRLVKIGLIATQTFERDWLPLILLIIISITGIGIAFDYSYLEGKTHQFMSVTHCISVILFLIWMPFGKFFHIFQRPAQVGANIYKTKGMNGKMAICPHTKEPFTSQMHVDDLKIVTKELGYNFELKNGDSHLDLSPEGKRSRLAQAHLKARQESGSYFG